MISDNDPFLCPRSAHRGRCTRRRCVWLMLLINILVQTNPQRFWEHEHLNHYQLLGFAQPENTSRRKRVNERAKITQSDIKKAYRKQAQLWHPDKISGKLKQGNNSSTVSIEESNDRFARIAQAYETLSNPDKRAEYDLFLLHQEDERLKHRQDEHSHQGEPATSREQNRSFFDNFQSSDPWALFEQFFFGTSTNTFTFDTYEKEAESRTFSPNTLIQPTRVSESTQVRYDEQMGTYVHRVLHREEYDQDPPYYRVIGQEFVEDFHPFYGFSLGYSPITTPYLIEEGFLPTREPIKEPQYQHTPKSQSQSQSPSQSQSQIHRKILPRISSKLESNQYMTTKKSLFLRSENKYYYAGLTPDCELVVMYDKGYETNSTVVDDVLVWTSESYIPYSYQQAHGGSCFLALYHGQLAVVVGQNPDQPISVLWSSPKPLPIVSNTEKELDYYASLDNDGSLVVYRRKMTYILNEPPLAHTKESTDHTIPIHESVLKSISQWWSRVIQTSKRASQIPPKTHAARAWKSMQQWAVKTLTGQPPLATPRSSQHYSSHDHDDLQRHGFVIDECVFASSPAGCVTPGRLVIHASKHIRRSLDKTMGNLDNAWDHFLSVVMDEDADLVDSAMRLFGKVGQEVGKAGIKIAREGMIGFHRVAKAAHDALQGSGWKEESDWSDE